MSFCLVSVGMPLVGGALAAYALRAPFPGEGPPRHLQATVTDTMCEPAVPRQWVVDNSFIIK